MEQVLDELEKGRVAALDLPKPNVLPSLCSCTRKDYENMFLLLLHFSTYAYFFFRKKIRLCK